MDGNVIFVGCPHGDIWGTIDRTVQREWAIRLIQRAIAGFLADDEVPDNWEAAMLGCAIGALSIGFYTLSHNNVAMALTPISDRGHYALISPISLAQLDEALQAAIAYSASRI